MINQRAVDLVIKCLTEGVVHPGDGQEQPAKLLAHLPAFRNAGLPPEQAAEFAAEAGLPDSDAAKVYAEALINSLETDGGMEIIDRAQLEALRAEAATPQQANETVPEVSVHCHCNPRTPLLQVPMGNRAKVTVDGAMLKAHVGEVCTC